MKIINALKSGFLRSAKVWKAVLIITLALFFLISFFTISVKGVLKSSLRSSAVTEHLTEGINLDIVPDLSGNMKNYLSSLSSGLFLMTIAGMILFTFFSGGLFNSLNFTQGKFSVAQFFRASAAYFWPFLGISVIISLIIGFIIFSLGGIIMGISMAGDAVKISGSGIIGISSLLIFAVVLSVFFLVADYARAHYSASAGSTVFKAIGNGFKMTFGSFSSSVPMMLILIIVQVLFVWMMSRLFFIWKPSTGSTLFLMFFASQLMFFMRILLRSWRYASVISMMESLEKKAISIAETRENDIPINENYPLI